MSLLHLPHLRREAANAVRLPCFSMVFTAPAGNGTRGWSTGQVEWSRLVDALCERLNRDPNSVWVGRNTIGEACVFGWSDAEPPHPRILGVITTPGLDLDRFNAALQARGQAYMPGPTNGRLA